MCLLSQANVTPVFDVHGKSLQNEVFSPTSLDLDEQLHSQSSLEKVIFCSFSYHENVNVLSSSHRFIVLHVK